MSVAAAAPSPFVAVTSAELDLAGIVAAPLRADLVLQRQLFRGNEYYVIKGEGHGFYEQKDSFAFYLGKLEAFLAKYNPADQA